MVNAVDIVKTFHNGIADQTVLKGVSLAVQTGEFVAIMGRSGAGKSTLLYQLSLLDHPTSGSVTIDGVATETLTSRQRTDFRLTKLGFVFQDYALLPELTAQENVAVPLLMQGVSRRVAYGRAAEALERVKLASKLKNPPSKLSGGEQQRVSIARSIAHEPKIIFADEPTANLDSETGRAVIDIFLELNRAGQTIVMVTHEDEYGARAHRIIRLSDGEIVS